MFIKPDRCNQTSLNNQSINFLSLKALSCVVMQTEVRILNLWPLAAQPRSVVIITPVRLARQCSWGGMQISADSILPRFCSHSSRAQSHSSTLGSLVILWCPQRGPEEMLHRCITPPTSLSITEGQLPFNHALQSSLLLHPIAGIYEPKWNVISLCRDVTVLSGALFRNTVPPPPPLQPK